VYNGWAACGFDGHQETFHDARDLRAVVRLLTPTENLRAGEMMLVARYCKSLKGRPFALPKQTSALPFAELRPHDCSNWPSSGFDGPQEVDERREASASCATRKGGGAPKGSAEERWGLAPSHVEPPSLSSCCRWRTACEKRPPRSATPLRSESRRAGDRLTSSGMRRGKMMRKGRPGEPRRPTNEIHGTQQWYQSCIVAGWLATSMGVKRPSTAPVISRPLRGSSLRAKIFEQVK